MRLTLVAPTSLESLAVENCSFCSWRRERYSVVVVDSLEHVICREFGMCSRSLQHVESVLRLWYQLWPQNEWEIGMAGAQSCDKMALVCADRSLRCVCSMVVRLHELDSQFALLFQKLHYCLRCNIVQDIKPRLEPSLCQVF